MRHQEKETAGLIISLFLFHLIGGCAPYQNSTKRELIDLTKVPERELIHAGGNWKKTKLYAVMNITKDGLPNTKITNGSENLLDFQIWGQGEVANGAGKQKGLPKL